MRRSWMRVLQPALSGLLVGLLASGPALAQQPAVRLLPRVVPSAAAPTITVLVVPLDAAAQAQLARLTYQAEQAVAGAQRFELVRLTDALDAQAAQEREAKATEAAAALQEGQKAYDELDTQKALQEFDKAAQLYEGSDLSRHFMDMSRARVMKIAAYVANGDNKAFQRELKEVLARNPHAEFSSNFFPPDELAVVEKVRRGILAEATRTLEVKTGDVPAQVFVDGKYWGISPVTLSEQTAAEHFVTAIAPGYALAQGRFRGEAALTLQPVSSQARLKDWVSRAAAAPEGADRDAALRELGTFVEAQQVLALLVRGTPSATGQDAIALRVEVSDGHTPGYAEGPLPLSGAAGDAALQAMLASVLQTDAPRGKGGKPTKHYATQGASSGRKTAGYVLLATGAALVAGGVYFGLEASSKADDFNKLPQTDPRAEKIRSDGKTYALVADVGMIAGVAAAGAGTWLAFLSGGGGEDSGAKKARAAPSPAPRQDTAPAAAQPEDKPTAPAATSKTQDKAATPPAGKPEDKSTAPATGADKATAAPAAPQGKSTPASRAEEKKRAEEEKKQREEEERLKREEEAKRKQAEEDKRKEEERLKREAGDKKKQEEERLKREEEEKKKQEEERKKREEEEKKKREEEARRKREEEEKRKREEEEKKKRPALDEDDLRNY